MWEKRKNYNTYIFSRIRVDNFVESNNSLNCFSFYAIKSLLRLSNARFVNSVETLFELYPNLLITMNKLAGLGTNFDNFLNATNASNHTKACEYAGGAKKEFIEKYESKFPHVDRHDSYFIDDLNFISYCSSFRRLQNKAQVYSLEVSDFSRTRLSHSVEVSNLCDSICAKINFEKLYDLRNWKYIKNPHYTDDARLICRSAGLIHDIGNPPFGHFGEDVIKSYFTTYLNDDLNEELKKDLCNFDGNAQSLRVVAKLQKHKKSNSLFLTSGVLGSIIKYPFSSLKAGDDCKFGYFLTEQKLAKSLEATGTYKESIRNPLVLILEAADDICYLTSDLEDAIHKEIIGYDDFVQILDEDKNFFFSRINNYKNKIGKENFLDYMRSSIYKLREILIKEVAEQFNKDSNLIFNIGVSYNYHLLDKINHSKLVDVLKDDILTKIYISKKVTFNEIQGYEILNSILKVYSECLDDASIYYRKKEFKFENKYYKKIFSLVSETFVENYFDSYFEMKKEGKYQKPELEKYLKCRMLIDFVSGMTDNYAKEVYSLCKSLK